MNTATVDRQVQQFRDNFRVVREEVSRVIVGNDDNIVGIMHRFAAIGSATTRSQNASISAADVVALRLSVGPLACNVCTSSAPAASCTRAAAAMPRATSDCSLRPSA